MTEQTAMRIVLDQRIAILPGVRTVGQDDEPIWIARKDGLKASAVTVEGAVEKLMARLAIKRASEAQR